MTATASPAPPRKKRSCLPTCLILLLLSGCLLVALAGGGYYAVQSAQLSPMALQARLNGTSEFSVINTAGSELTIEMTQLDPAMGNHHSTRLPGWNHWTLVVRERCAGKVSAWFVTAEGLPADAVCSLNLNNGDIYQFIVVPEGIVVAKEGASQQGADELDVLTSSLCQR